jgi:hypothetical protein
MPISAMRAIGTLKKWIGSSQASLISVAQNKASPDWPPARRRRPTACPLGMAQAAEIDRHRLGPAEQDAAGRQQQNDDRHQDRAHRIDMLQRIGGDAPGLPGRRITEMARRVAVRRLVQGDRQNHRQGGDGDGLDQFLPCRSPQSRPNGASGPSPARTSTGGAGQIDNGGRLDAAIAAVEDQFELARRAAPGFPSLRSAALRRRQ